MKIKELSILRERKVNLGNYESVGFSYGVVVELSDKDDKEKVLSEMEEFIEGKIKVEEEKWNQYKKYTGVAVPVKERTELSF